ncbi:MAG TPA: hypothetical protein VII73_13355 [Caulobacteraceae bacterium]
MTDQLKTIQDDIAFLKNLAQDGGAPATLGGSIMVAAGLIFGAASLGHWLVQTGRIAASPWAYFGIWIGATALFMVVLSALKRRAAGVKAGGARAAGIAWAGVGCTIFALWGSVAIVAWRAQSTLPALLLPSIILALYGLGWMVGAAVSGKRWIWLTSLASYLMALVLAWVSMTADVMLIFAATLAVLAVAPGIALMRQTRGA